MQNENHYIPEENDIPDGDIKKLPDRSDLSKLYYETNRGYQKGSVNFKRLSNEDTQTTYSKKLYAVFIPIGIAMPALLASSILAYAFFVGRMVDKFSIMINLPLLAVTGVVFALSTYGILGKIREKLNALGVSVPKFFGLLVAFLILSYEPAFVLFAKSSNEFSSFAFVMLAFAGFSVLYTWLLLKGLSDDRIPETTKNIMIFAPLIVCFIFTTLASLAMLG